MSNPSPQPIEAKPSDKVFWENRAAQLKQRLMERRIPTAVAQPVNTSSSQRAPEESQREKQPSSGQAGPIQTKTTVAQSQSDPSLSHKLPDDKGTLKETSQLKKPSTFSPAEQSTPIGSAQSSTAMIEKLMEKPSTSTPSKTAGNDTSDVPMVVNEVRCNANAPSVTNGRAAITVQEKTDASAYSEAQQGDNSTDKKEKRASRSSTEGMAVPDDESKHKSSIEDGEITTKPSAPLDKNPVQEPTPQHASRKKASPTRVSTGTSIVPIKTRAERRVSGPLEATPASKHRGPQGNTAPARSSVSRPQGRNGHRRASSPVRHRRTDRNDNMTWETYKVSPLDHHAHPRAGREQRHRSKSPVAMWQTDGDGDREVKRLASRYPELRDWLEYTGWHFIDYRMSQLDRLRRMADNERENSQLRKEVEREKARLKEYREPASKVKYLSDAGSRPMPFPLAPTQQAGDVERPKYRKLGPYSVTDGFKRKRSEESDDDRDGSYSPNYYQHRQGGRSPPSRGLPESSAPRSLPQRNPRAPFRSSSPAGYPLPRNDFDAGRATDCYMTRDILPILGSSPPQIRGHFHEP
ncbi:hypothetical protein F5883DRAFT_712218 [Diaporthe sp. PMI_573]|nr:hypothetical protein F5883DRAFT_712218 [Diaporthaceae sp. PMI_573]